MPVESSLDFKLLKACVSKKRNKLTIYRLCQTTNRHHFHDNQMALYWAEVQNLPLRHSIYRFPVAGGLSSLALRSCHHLGWNHQKVCLSQFPPLLPQLHLG